MNSLTSAQIRYLKTLNQLNRRSEIRVTDIADELNISKPGVVKTLRTLQKLNLIEYQKYGKITLTDEGKIVSNDIVNKYTTVYRFFHEVLDIPKEIAKKDTDKLFFEISCFSLTKLEKYLIEKYNFKDIHIGECDDKNYTSCELCIKKENK